MNTITEQSLLQYLEKGIDKLMDMGVVSFHHLTPSPTCDT